MAEEIPKLWTPDVRVLGASIAEVVKAYALLLEVRYPQHDRAFDLRTKSDPLAANAEAVVFSWLRWHGMSPTLSDDPGIGGPDYLCSPKLCKPFMIEVTTLKSEAVSGRSGWPDQLDDRVRSFAMITPNLWSKTKAKAPQLGGHETTRVLAICLTHAGAGVLLGSLAAEWLMTSQPKLSVPVGAPISQLRDVTDLRKSAFLMVQDGEVVPVRRSISAILLIAIWEQELQVVGILHPDPAVRFDYKALTELPFLRLEWPVRDGVLRTEWVVANPQPRTDLHVPIAMTDDELHGS